MAGDVSAPAAPTTPPPVTPTTAPVTAGAGAVAASGASPWAGCIGAAAQGLCSVLTTVCNSSGNQGQAAPPATR